MTTPMSTDPIKLGHLFAENYENYGLAAPRCRCAQFGHPYIVDQLSALSPQFP